MVMSYTAIPPQDRMSLPNNSSDKKLNGTISNGSAFKPSRNSSIVVKSPNSIPRRSSTSVAMGNTLVHAPEQEIYEGFTFLQELRQRKKPLFPCPLLAKWFWCYHNSRQQQHQHQSQQQQQQHQLQQQQQQQNHSSYQQCCWCCCNRLGICFSNPFSFSNGGLERIYQKYFTILYQASLLSRFLLLLSLCCFTMGLIELIPLFEMGDKKDTTTSIRLPGARCWLLVSLGVLSGIPLFHMHSQCCMRPKHLTFIRGYALLLCFLFVPAVSPLVGGFNKGSVSMTTVGLWEVLWLVILLAGLFPASIYSFIVLSLIIFISHSLIVILQSVFVSGNAIYPTYFHWIVIGGNWLMFAATCLIGCILNYLQQKLLRNAFLHTRQFLNHCVDAKVASEKLDRLLGCIAPAPIVPELRQTLLLGKDWKGDMNNNETMPNAGTGPSVVHLRNISFISVQIVGLNTLTASNNNSSTTTAANNKATNEEDENLAGDAVKLMNELFSRFDMLGQELGCYRIRAHPDDYLALAGYPETRVDHAKSCVELGFRIQQTVRQLCDLTGGLVSLEVRCAVHTGTTYGTVLGRTRQLFDLLGDDVRSIRNLVSMARPGRVIVSKSTYDQLPDGYKGEPGPRLEGPFHTTSFTTSGELSCLETFYLKPRHTKKSSLLGGEIDGLTNSTVEKDERPSSVLLCSPNLTQLPRESAVFSNNGNQNHGHHHQPQQQQQQQQTQQQGTAITQAQAVEKLAQLAKFNVNTPYYFLHDDSFFLSPPQFVDHRLFLDIGPGAGGISFTSSGPGAGASIMSPSSPVYLGTNKSSTTTWKSTLRSQMTQSLIGSHQIEDSVIVDQTTDSVDLSVSRVTGNFTDPSMEKKFQESSEIYLGISLLCCMATVLLVTSVHGLLLAKTVILLLLFLVVFMWIGLTLLLLLLAKMKCISTFLIKHRLCCITMLTVTILGMFSLFAGNSFCCHPTMATIPQNRLQNTTSSPSPSVTNTENNLRKYIQTQPNSISKSFSSVTQSSTDFIGANIKENHLQCPVPIFSILSTMWALLPLVTMFALPELIKLTLIIMTIIINCVLVFYTHLPLFQQYSHDMRKFGVPTYYTFSLVMQLFFGAFIMMQSRILNSFRRLEYQWSIKTSMKLKVNHKLTEATDQVIDLLLPKFVSTQLLNSSKHYMSLYSRQHQSISVLSICVPGWCPPGITEPSDVAARIRMLNRVLGAMDELLMGPDCVGVTKIRCAGETAWYAMGIDTGPASYHFHNEADSGTESFMAGKKALTLLYTAEMMKKIVNEHNRKNPEYHFVLRMGIHSGSGYSGVVGGSKPEFGVWGEAAAGATLVQRYAQLDRIYVTGQFLTELETVYRDNFYDVGALCANIDGQLIAPNQASTSENSMYPPYWSLRILSLRDTSNYQPVISNSFNAVPPPICSEPVVMAPISSSPNQMINSNLISLCSEDSVFPMTNTNLVQHLPHQPSINPLITPNRNSMSFLSNNSQDTSVNDNYNAMMMNPAYMVQLPNLMSPISSQMLPNPHNYQSPPIIQNQLTSGTVSPLAITSTSNEQYIVTSSSNMVRSQGDYNNNPRIFNADKKTSRIHRYKNLATELPHSIIPPSPPPHRRTYSDEVEPSTQPIIPPRNNNKTNHIKKEELKPPQSELIVPQRAPISNASNPKSNQLRVLTPSSSMDSFLELEKACSSQPRVKSLNNHSGAPLIPTKSEMQHYPHQRLSLIPETSYLHYQSSQNNPITFEQDDIMTASDDRVFDGIEGDDKLDVMTTSDDRVFGNESGSISNPANKIENRTTESSLLMMGCGATMATGASEERVFMTVDNSDITSHHNPIYTDNEYESMAESQMNLLDNNPDEFQKRLSQNVKTRGIVHDMSLDFPDYRRPDSPPCPGNGDDSDHLSKRNRNSSNSRDSSSMVVTNGPNGGVRRSGGATSSDESNKQLQQHELLDASGPQNGANAGQSAQDSPDKLQERIEKERPEPFCNRPSHNVTKPISTAIPSSEMGMVTDNASSCMSLVTDMGWTSYDDQDYDSEVNENVRAGANYYNVNIRDGYQDSLFSHGNSNNKCNNNSSNKNNNSHIDRDDLDLEDDPDNDESDLDAIRLHSDLISDYSENPLVSDLDELTDTDINYSSNALNGSRAGSEKISSFYKFPLNNRLNPRFYDDNRVGGSMFHDEKLVTSTAGIFSSHPWHTGSMCTTENDLQDEIYSQPAAMSHRHQQTSTGTSQVLTPTSMSVACSANATTSTSASTPGQAFSAAAVSTRGGRLPAIAPVRMPNFSQSVDSATDALHHHHHHQHHQPQQQHQQQQFKQSQFRNGPSNSRIPIRCKPTSGINDNAANNGSSKIPTRGGQFSQMHSSDQSDYDNVSQQGGKGKLVRSRETRSLDINRFLNGEDSDAMSGYVGDVASSVYDSDECDNEVGRKFNFYRKDDNDQQLQQQQQQQQLQGDIMDNIMVDIDDDPMAPFFPRLPNQPTSEEAIRSQKFNRQSGGGSNTGSSSGGGTQIKSDYDNVDSDKQNQNGSNNEIRPPDKFCNPDDKNFQKQIAEEARKISRVYRKQWTNDVDVRSDARQSCDETVDGRSYRQSSEDHVSQDNRRSTRDMSVDSWDSPTKNDITEMGFHSEQEARCQSTDCVLTNRHLDSGGSHSDASVSQVGGQQLQQDNNNVDSQNQRQQSCSSQPSELARLRERADKVRSLLPPELHPYVLPGCFSNSSVNSSSGNNESNSRLPGNHVKPRHHQLIKSRKSHYSDEERSKRSV